jgi:membrane protein involved in colicin uptake
MTDTEKQKKSLVQKILSMETMIFLVGLYILGSGIYRSEPMQYFFGGMIISGSIVLHFVRKKDWKKHWEEQEAMQRRYEARRKMEQEGKNGE